MGRGRSTIVLLMIALGFGAYLYFIDAKRPVEDENAKAKVFSYETSKINQVQIKASSGDVTALKKGTSGDWTIVKPVEAPADRTAISDVVTNLASLEEDRVVEENAADLKIYGLAEPRIDVTFNVEGEKDQKRILFGDKNPTGVGLYAKLPGNNRVFIVSNSLDVSMNRGTFDLRDKTALKFEQDKVDSIDIVSRNQAIRLEKSGQDWKLVKPIQAPADYISVNGLLGQLQSAQVTALKDRPEDIKDLKQYGLDRPGVVATLGIGTSKVTLELGREAEAASVWARDPSKPAVFSVGNSLAEELRKTPKDLRRKEIFEFRPFNTNRFEITRGKDTRAFERVKGTGENAVDTWKQVAPATKTVDASNFEGALLDFSNLRAESFIDRGGPAAGLNTPAATITVKFDEGKKEERVTFGRVRSDVFAARPDQPGALKVEAGRFDEALKKLDAIQ
jgi:uncharacterized protein DUF4340